MCRQSDPYRTFRSFAIVVLLLCSSSLCAQSSLLSIDPSEYPTIRCCFLRPDFSFDSIRVSEDGAAAPMTMMEPMPAACRKLIIAVIDTSMGDGISADQWQQSLDSLAHTTDPSPFCVTVFIPCDSAAALIRTIVDESAPADIHALFVYTYAGAADSLCDLLCSRGVLGSVRPLYFRVLPDVDDVGPAFDHLNAWIDSLIVTEHATPQWMSLTDSRTLSWYFAKKGRLIGDFGLNNRIFDVPRERVRATYIDSMMLIATSLSVEYQFPAALDTLYHAFRTTSSEELVHTATSTVKACAQWIRSTGSWDTMDSLTRRAEENWQFSASGDRWYRELKSSMSTARATAKSTDADKDNSPSESARERRAGIAENQEKSGQGSLINKTRTSAVNGEQAASRNDLWESASSYRASLKLVNDPIAQKKMRDAVLEALRTDAEAGQWKRLYTRGKEFSLYFKSDFLGVFYFARGCAGVQDYPLACTQYEWLIANWSKEQSVVTWDSACTALQQLYTNSFLFDEAIKLSKRTYRIQERSGILQDVIGNFRAKYITCVLRALGVMYEQCGSEGLRQFLGRKGIPSTPYYINNISLLSAAGAMVIMRGGKKSPPLPDLGSVAGRKPFPALIRGIPGKTASWLILPVGQQFIVCAFSTAVDDLGQVLLSNVMHKKAYEEPWTQLADTEQRLGERFAAELISDIWSIDRGMNGSLLLSRYWQVLGNGTPLLYLVRYDNNAAVKESFAFDIAAVKADAEMWKKSSHASAFFTQSIQYSGKRIDDVAIPIYDGRGGKFAVRLGFKPM